MGIRRFQDLEAWQLARDVKREVFALTGTGPIVLDQKFRNQIRESSASAPRNIAEGFGRYRPAEFANKVRIALGELHETLNSLLDGADRGHFASADVERIANLLDRAIKVSTKLHSYLERCTQEGLYERPAKNKERPKR